MPRLIGSRVRSRAIRYSLSFEVETFAIVLLILVLCGAFLLELFGLFGTLVVFIASLLYALLTQFQLITPSVLATLLVLYLLGEVLEYGLVMVGAKAFGASRKAGIWAVIGGILGAFLGLFMGGIGIFPGALMGIFLGAFLAEWGIQKSMGRSTLAGIGSIVGRFSAIFSKAIICLVMIAIICARLWGGLSS
jgi:uncharacterized protein